MKIFEWLFFWWFPVIGRELQCPLGTITLHLSLPQARWYVGSWLCSRLLSWAHDLVLNQSVHHSPSWPQWWVQGWACDIMRSNPGIFAVASQTASSFSCPESKLSVLPLWKKILNNHAAKAGERRAKRCKEKALTSLSEPPSLALFALDLPVSCFPCGSAGKESAYNVGDLGSVPRLGRSSGEGNGYPLQYSGLENSMECIVHGVRVGHDWVTFTFQLYESMHSYCIIQFQKDDLWFEAQRFQSYRKPVHLHSTFWYPNCFTYYVNCWFLLASLRDKHGKCYHTILKVKYLEQYVWSFWASSTLRLDLLLLTFQPFPKVVLNHEF